MQLGIFTKDKKTGVFSGGLRTLTNAIDGIIVTPIQKRGSEGPDFRVQGPNGSDFGAGWSKLAKEGGNGRAQLTLMHLIAQRAGHPMKLERVKKATFLPAMIESFAGDLTKLRKEIAALCRQDRRA